MVIYTVYDTFSSGKHFVFATSGEANDWAESTIRDYYGVDKIIPRWRENLAIERHDLKDKASFVRFCNYISQADAS